MMQKRAQIRNSGRQKEQGVILILTLWIVVVLSLIAYSLTYELRLELKLTKLHKDKITAHALARAGVAKAIVDLKNDMYLDYAEKSQPFDGEGDIWKKTYEDDEALEFEGGQVKVKVVDEESKIDLNKASIRVLTALIKRLGYEDKDALETACAIVDWRDADRLPRVGRGRDENEIYAELRHEKEDRRLSEDIAPYRSKNDRFQTVDELLEVYGVTPKLFYGYDPQASEDRRQRPRFRGERPPVGLRDLVTVRSNRVVNINTAGPEVLSAIIEAAAINESDPGALADKIIEYRRGAHSGEIDNDQAFRSVQDLGQISEISGMLLNRMRGAYPLDVRSYFFTIHSTGEVGRVKRSIQVLVWRSLDVFHRDENLDDREVRRRRRRSRDETMLIKEPALRCFEWVEI